MSVSESLISFVEGCKSSDEPKVEKIAKLSHMLLEMREINREAYTRLREAKRLVIQERSIYDEKVIALESIKYERRHLESEISDCKQYVSNYESIGLVGVDEFKAGHMDMDLESEHHLMLERLNDELARRKSLMDQVKLAEIARDAEKEKLSKSRKELENLRDHAKTIYKMAGSYKLASFVSKPVEEKKLVAPLQKLLDDFLSYAAERDGWRVELVAAESAQAELEEGEQEESVVAEDLDDEDDKTKAPESRHSSSLSQPRPVLYKKRFDFEYLEIVPALDVFDGVVTFHHATAGNQVSPILMSFDSEGFDGTAENVDVFVKALALDASLLLSVEASRLAGAESDGGVAYRWVQTLAGLEADMAYSDSQRCIAAFFKALAAASPLQFSKPATNKAEAPSSNAMEI